MKSYYWNNGWFNVETKSEIIPLNKEKRARVEYFVETGTPYDIDSIKTRISSTVLDSIYKKHDQNSLGGLIFYFLPKQKLFIKHKVKVFEIFRLILMN